MILFPNKASRNQWNFAVALPLNIITEILLKFSITYNLFIIVCPFCSLQPLPPK